MKNDAHSEAGFPASGSEDAWSRGPIELSGELSGYLVGQARAGLGAAFNNGCLRLFLLERGVPLVVAVVAVSR
jgi:hypothetical protein